MSHELLIKPRLLLSGEKLTAEESKYNLREKYIPQPDGSLKLVEEMCCNRFIFNPDGVEEYNKTERLRREAWAAQLDEEYGHARPQRSAQPEGCAARSQRRAKQRLRDYILCNDFSNFVTLTLSPDEIDRRDYAAIMKKLNRYLDNRVRRNGLKYIGVPELHKSGGFHFHFLTNDTLPLVYSGTVVRPNGGRPVKEATAMRQGFDIGACRRVYNVKDWRLGFTTSIYTYGDREAVAAYIGKYITKSYGKIGGRWYYSGGELLKPVYKYRRESFGDFVGDYGFQCDGGAFIIRKYPSKDSADS